VVLAAVDIDLSFERGPPECAFWRSRSICSVLNSNCVPVRSTGFATCSLASSAASSMSSSSSSRLYTFPKDAMDLSLARRTVSVAEFLVGGSLVVLFACLGMSLRLSRADSWGQVEVLVSWICSHFNVRSQRSSLTISSESLSFADDVVPLSGFHFTSL
jgi:hypothetical protein